MTVMINVIFSFSSKPWYDIKGIVFPRQLTRPLLPFALWIFSGPTDILLLLLLQSKYFLFLAASLTVKVLIDNHSSIKIRSCKSSLSVLHWLWCSKGREDLIIAASMNLPIMSLFFCKIPWQKQLRRERFIWWTVPSPSPSLWGNQVTRNLKQ